MRNVFNGSNETPFYSIEFKLNKNQYYDLFVDLSKVLVQARRFYNRRINLFLYFFIIIGLTLGFTNKLLLMLKVTPLTYYINQKFLASLLVVAILCIFFIVISKIFIFFADKSDKNKRKNFASIIKDDCVFTCKFYPSYFEISSYVQSGVFYWDDFESIVLYTKYLVLTFYPSKIRGFQWSKDYDTIIIPIGSFCEREDVFNYIKQLDNFYDNRHIG